MATYNKRGNRPKTKEEIEHNIEEASTTAEVFNKLDQTASITEEFVEKNKNIIFIAIGFVVVFVLGYLGYKEFIAKPKQLEAMKIGRASCRERVKNYEVAKKGKQTRS